MARAPPMAFAVTIGPSRYKLDEVCALEARGWVVLDVDSVVQTQDIAADITAAAVAAGVAPPGVPGAPTGTKAPESVGRVYRWVPVYD